MRRFLRISAFVEFLEENTMLSIIISVMVGIGMGCMLIILTNCILK